MSFFDEDDEPRTRVRSRRPSAAAAGGGTPDRQTARMRQLTLLGMIVLVALVLLFLVRSCQTSARENALKDYNRTVGTLVRDSDSNVSQPFFELMRNPDSGAGDLQTQINGYSSQAKQQYDQAKRIDTPGDMEAAQRSFLIVMELRRDGLDQIAARLRTAVSSDAEAADTAINQIAGAMGLFYSSDVLYQQRVTTLIDAELREADVGEQQLQRTQFLPGVQWLVPDTVADVLGQQLTTGESGGGGGGGTPEPGLHGTGIDGVQVGELALEPDSPNRIPYAADTEFTVQFTNSGEHDEQDVRVVLRIEGGPKPISVSRRVASVAAGAQATATLALGQRPPLGSPVTIRVEVRPVPGEENRDNNTSEFNAAFIQQ